MFKKIIIIILIILIVGLIGLIISTYYSSKKNGDDITLAESILTVLPFGESSDRIFSDTTDDNDFIKDQLETGNGVQQIGTPVATDVSRMRLRQVTTFPVVGVSVTDTEEEGVKISFIARGNGHVFQTSPNSSLHERISNTTILRVRDVLWLSDGESFVARLLDEEGASIDSFYAEINRVSTSTAGALEGKFLEGDITDLVVADGEDKIFYLTEIPTGGSTGILSNPDGGEKKQIFSSPLSEWKLEWPTEGQIALTTRAHSHTPGYLFFLNTNTGAQTKIISGFPGLTTLVSNTARQVLFTQNKGNKLLLSVLDVKSDTTTDLSVWTLSEKCVWSKKRTNIVYCAVPGTIPEATDLDLWYRGAMSFSDSIWMIDTQNQTSSILIEPRKVVNESLDVTHPTLSPSEEHLFFIDKQTSYLWQLKLE